MLPLRIKVKEKRCLAIEWDDKTHTEIKLSNLRRHCPCAVCAEEKSNESSSYIPIYSDQQLAVKSIQAVGKYAIAIIWGDDHNTGIYDYSYLKNISENKVIN